MKKYLIILALLLLPLAASGQVRNFRALCDKYSARHGYTVVEMSGDMLKAIGASGSKNIAVNIPLKNIDNMIIIVSEKESAEFKNDVKNMIADGGYSKLSSVNSSGSNVSIYASQIHGALTEIIMTVNDGGDNVVMSITGADLNVGQIVSKLGKDR